MLIAYVCSVERLYKRFLFVSETVVLRVFLACLPVCRVMERDLKN